MKTSTGNPDSMPPGVRGILYAVVCWLLRHPDALRRIGALLRYWPSLAGRLGQAVRASAAKGVLTRPTSCSNAGHRPNLVAGDYMIAMDPGPTYDDDRKLLEGRLAILDVQTGADVEAKRLATQLKQPGQEPFDLLEKYMMWVVFEAIKPVWGGAGSRIAAGASGNTNDRGLQLQYMLEIRYVAGQLLAGGMSTPDIRRRAELCGKALSARMKGVTSDIQKAWNVSIPDNDLERSAAGLSWVSHPVTVQSGALIVQELLRRPDVYRKLRKKAEQAGAGVWTDYEFRKCVWEHVLELMRFRPIFPLIPRVVPRDTEFETGGRYNADCPAGGNVAVWSIGALFDSNAVKDSKKFCPHRNWGDEEDLRWMMFGFGSRQCPAKDHAVNILTSALIGLLTMPELQLARDDGKAITYDGPLMSGMRVRIAGSA